MPNEELMQPEAPETAAVLQETAPAIGPNEIKKFISVLRDYKTGKGATDRRIIASEQWWKLRNTEEEQKETEVGKDGGFTSRSGWLHNVIVSKHADAMEVSRSSTLCSSYIISGMVRMNPVQFSKI